MTGVQTCALPIFFKLLFPSHDNKVLIVIVFSLSLNAAVETSSSLTKQKMEVLELKNELNNFYNEKEKEYQRQKKGLD